MFLVIDNLMEVDSLVRQLEKATLFSGKDDQFARNDRLIQGDHLMVTKERGGILNTTRRSFLYSSINDQLQRNDEGPTEDDQAMFEKGNGRQMESRSNHTINGRSIRSSNSIEYDQQPEENEMIPRDGESKGNASPRMEDMANQTGKRKRLNKFTGRVTITLEAQEAANPREVEVDPMNANVEHDRPPRRAIIHGSANSAVEGNVGNDEATSKIKKKGERGKYKSYVVDMKIKGKQSKLSICIPYEIDRAIGDNARHLVNECGRVVRTRAPLDVKNWQEAFTRAGDGMWKEIQDKFEIEEGECYLKMQAFVVDTMQRLYRIWKTRLHYYYKSPKCGKTDEEYMRNPPPDLPQDQWEYCVKRFGSPEFKTKENKNVKPSADVIWLAEHTCKGDKGVLEWVDRNHSKEIHDKLKNAIANADESKTQEEMLLEVLRHRSGYFCGKGIAIRPYTKGRQQLLQQKLVEKHRKRYKNKRRG